MCFDFYFFYLFFFSKPPLISIYFFLFFVILSFSLRGSLFLLFSPLRERFPQVRFLLVIELWWRVSCASFHVSLSTYESTFILCQFFLSFHLSLLTFHFIILSFSLTLFFIKYILSDDFVCVCDELRHASTFRLFLSFAFLCSHDKLSLANYQHLNQSHDSLAAWTITWQVSRISERMRVTIIALCALLWWGKFFKKTKLAITDCRQLCQVLRWLSRRRAITRIPLALTDAEAQAERICKRTVSFPSKLSRYRSDLAFVIRDLFRSNQDS